MPKVIYEDDRGNKKENHFKYTEEGMKAALAFAKQTGGRIEYGNNSSGASFRGTRQYKTKRGKC